MHVCMYVYMQAYSGLCHAQHRPEAADRRIQGQLRALHAAAAAAAARPAGPAARAGGLEPGHAAAHRGAHALHAKQDVRMYTFMYT